MKLSIGALQEFADPEWVEELRTQRNQVEYVNAFFIQSGRTELNKDERQDVDDVLDQLQAALTIH